MHDFSTKFLVISTLVCAALVAGHIANSDPDDDPPRRDESSPLAEVASPWQAIVGDRSRPVLSDLSTVHGVVKPKPRGLRDRSLAEARARSRGQPGYGSVSTAQQSPDAEASGRSSGADLPEITTIEELRRLLAEVGSVASPRAQEPTLAVEPETPHAHAAPASAERD